MISLMIRCRRGLLCAALSTLAGASLARAHEFIIKPAQLHVQPGGQAAFQHHGRRTFMTGEEVEAPAGWEAYMVCLKNKNILPVSLVFMAGAAGRGQDIQDINEVYIIPHFVHDFNLDLTHAAFLFSLIQIGSLIGPFVWGWISDRLNRKLVIQASLLMSGICTLWLAWQESVSAGLLLNFVAYGASVTSRQTLTQALLADMVGEHLFDAAFSLYYFIGFVSIPFWTVITGGIMTNYGFGPAFSLISMSYLLAMSLLAFLRAPDKAVSPTSTGSSQKRQ